MKKASLLILSILLLLITGNVYAEGTGYGVFIGDTEFNADRLTIPGTTGGTATYNPDTKTLTLKDFKYEGVLNEELSSQMDIVFTAIIIREENVKIIVDGNNKITFPDLGYSESGQKEPYNEAALVSPGRMAYGIVSVYDLDKYYDMIDYDNEDILNDIDKTKKLKNKQDKIKNANKPSSNQNIKHNINELNKKPNMTILETTQINQNNDNNLIPNIQNNIEQPKDKRNDAHLDTHYTSSNINKGNQINNQINTNNKKEIDVPYTSTVAANQINLDSNNNLDSGYCSAKNAASPINNNIEGNKINFNHDTNYVSTKMAGKPINNDSNNNVDPGYSSARIGEMQNNNGNNDLKSGYSSARHGVSPTDNNNTQINYNNNNQININTNINNHQDTGYSSATMGVPQTNNDTTNQVNNNNNDVSNNSNMANINNNQAVGQNAITELKTNENNQIKEEENYSGEFDK